ncbi:MAG: hypothetical protein QOH93_1225 [Chloroflexia bacterium]|jgi:hypothetical protein|nr:hypothetical protein [Chloroflexia bacterium]
MTTFYLDTPDGHLLRVHGSHIMRVETQQALMVVADLAYQQFSTGEHPAGAGVEVGTGWDEEPVEVYIVWRSPSEWKTRGMLVDVFATQELADACIEALPSEGGLLWVEDRNVIGRVHQG